MIKRFRYEFMRSLPFFLTLVLGGAIYWLIVRHMIMHPEILYTVPILLPIFIALAFVAASVIYVIVNVSRELSQPSGLLTFLTPLAPWKLMVAKWLNFMVSFGLSFLVMRFLLILFPLEEEGFPFGFQTLAALAENYNPVNVPFVFLTGMTAVRCLLFVLHWTFVLALVFWALGWTEVLYSRGVLRRGKFALRVVSFLVAFFAFDQLGSLVTRFSTWYVDVNTFQLFHPKTVARLDAFLEPVGTFLMEAGAGEPLYHTGTPILLIVFFLVAIVFLLWRAQAYWKKIDR